VRQVDTSPSAAPNNCGSHNARSMAMLMASPRWRDIFEVRGHRERAGHQNAWAGLCPPLWRGGILFLCR
jgi:hypothetical protein